METPPYRKEHGILVDYHAPDTLGNWRLVEYSDGKVFAKSFHGATEISPHDPRHPHHPDFDPEEFLTNGIGDK